MDIFSSYFPDLAKDRVIVHTTLRRIEEISWKLFRIIVTLHRRKETNVTVNDKV